MMNRHCEAQFKDWTKPPGKTQEGWCNHAVSAIHNAIKASNTLCARGVSVFAHRSHRIVKFSKTRNAANLQSKLCPDESRRIQCGAAHFGSKQMKKPGALKGVDFRVVPNANALR